MLCVDPLDSSYCFWIQIHGGGLLLLRDEVIRASPLHRANCPLSHHYRLLARGMLEPFWLLLETCLLSCALCVNVTVLGLRGIPHQWAQAEC